MGTSWPPDSARNWTDLWPEPGIPLLLPWMPGDSLDLIQSGIWISSSEVSQQDREGTESRDPSCPKLAQENLVHRHSQTPGRWALASSKQAKPLSQGPVFHPASQLPACNGIAVETRALKDRDITGSFFPILLKGRKSTSPNICHSVGRPILTCAKAGTITFGNIPFPTFWPSCSLVWISIWLLIL